MPHNAASNAFIVHHTYADTPIGRLTLAATDAGLIGVLWPDEAPGRFPLALGPRPSRHPVLDVATQQLDEYFAGRRQLFDFPTDVHGTVFQEKVWRAMLAIPFGETRTYGEIAAAIGQPTASRAIGGAANRNPLSIFAPCHRVVGSNGSLGGFAGGLAIKRTLLAIEGHRLDHSGRLIA